MRLIYYPLHLSFDIEQGKLTSIVLESPIVFEKFLLDLHCHFAKEETCFEAFEKEGVVDLIKRGELISSPFDLHYEKREVQKKLYTALHNLAEENDVAHILAEYHGKVVQELENLGFQSDYEVEMDEEFSIEDTFKNFGMHIKNPEGIFAEKLIEYIVTESRLLGKKFFFLANCDAFLTKQEYEHIGQYAAYYEICVIFLRQRLEFIIKLEN